MRHCSSVVDVDTRRSFEGPFSETAWSTVHCWRRSRRLALATVNLGASECNTSLRWDVTPDSIPNISPPDVLPTLGRQTWYAPSMGTCSPRVSACFSAVRLTRLRRNENRGDDGHSKMQELGQIGLDAAVDGGQSSDGYSRVTHCPLPGRAWPHRRRLDGWAAGMGSIHMSLVSALTILDRPSSFAQQGRLST